MHRPRILDGGLATGLEELGHELHPRLWSAGVFLKDPRAVEELHRTYVDCGAEILVSASYQMSFDGLARAGLDQGAAANAMRQTIEVARRAGEAAGSTPLVAASVGPFGATLADGSEYHGNYGLTVRQLVEFHRERLAVLAGSGADLLAVETVPSLDEARALRELLAGHQGVEAWVSFSCRDGKRLRDGREIHTAAALFHDCPSVAAVGVNCTAPRHVASLMDQIRRATDKPIVVYPNSGESWHAGDRSWSGSFAENEFLDGVRTWAEKGAWAIGGCCRVGPRTIRRIAAALVESGPDPSQSTAPSDPM